VDPPHHRRHLEGGIVSGPTLSDGARLVLLELEAPPATPITSAELAELFAGSFTSRQIGAWLRELRTAGRAEALDAQTRRPLDRVPAGTRTVWRAT
jgi:hypothetical protein